MKYSKLLMSLGSAMAASRIGKSISSVELEDVLGTVGLTRRRSHTLEHFGYLALGAAVGAGATVLLAPQSGKETRRKLGNQASRLTDAVRGSSSSSMSTAPQG